MLTGCGTQYASSQQCSDGKAPKNVTAQASYVLEQCENGQVLTLAVPSNYSSGQQAVNDPYFWMWMMGSNFSGSSMSRYGNFPYHQYSTHISYYNNPINRQSAYNRVSSGFRSSYSRANSYSGYSGGRYTSSGTRYSSVSRSYSYRR